MKQPTEAVIHWLLKTGFEGQIIGALNCEIQQHLRELGLSQRVNEME